MPYHLDAHTAAGLLSLADWHVDVDADADVDVGRLSRLDCSSLIWWRPPLWFGAKAMQSLRVKVLT